MAKCSLRRQTPKVGATCGKAARVDLCGGRSATGVPTAITHLTVIVVVTVGAVLFAALAARAAWIRAKRAYPVNSTESRFSQIRAALGFAILLIRLNGEWRRRWSMGRNRVKVVFSTMSVR
jgi:hypothetical protein